MAKNRLAYEQSPYLQQHADNPVDWYPWGDEAFEAAQAQEKPIFVSIGYATCHWCHVMAHESFEDEQVAALLNDTFINIKVDREERPDIDNTYMTVCQMMTGSGGWPLTIIMTPEKKPFYAATYLPKRGRSGRPGMMELIPWIGNLWQEQRDKVDRSAEEIISAFHRSNSLSPGDTPSDRLLDDAYTEYRNRFDREQGGFGSSPKFPSPHNLTFLLRYWKRSGNEEALQMVTKTLHAMRRGGLYDQVGFGFHRYATDEQWLLPHFEKMLYDQAMLMIAYTEGWQATGTELFKQTAEEIASYLQRDLLDPGNGFYSAEDADSEGEEGKFYLWSTEEIRDILPLAEAELFIEIYNLEEEGNFREETSGRRTGKNIPHLRKPIAQLASERDMEPDKLHRQIEEMRSALFNEREERVRPFLDDKILTDWNGLAIAALAKAGRAFGREGFISQAEATYRFVASNLFSQDGELLHRYRNGEAAIKAHADDYAFLIWGLLELYEATFHTPYLQRACELNRTFTDHFWDTDNGAYFFSSHDAEELIGRKKEGYDGAIPSGNSVAIQNLIRIGRMTADPGLEEKAEQAIRLFSEQLEAAPTGFGQMLQGVALLHGSSQEVVIAGNRDRAGTRKLTDTLNSRYLPFTVTVLAEPDDKLIRELAPYTGQQPMIADKPTAYVCRNYSCKRPVTAPGDLDDMLEELQ